MREEVFTTEVTEKGKKNQLGFCLSLCLWLVKTLLIGESDANETDRPPRRPRQDPWYVRWTLTLFAVGILTILVIVPIVSVFYHALEGGIGVYWNNLVLDPDTRHSILLTLAVAPTAVR